MYVCLYIGYDRSIYFNKVMTFDVCIKKTHILINPFL